MGVMARSEEGREASYARVVGDRDPMVLLQPRQQKSGEWHLWRAVMEDAVAIVRGHVLVDDRVYEETVDWVVNDVHLHVGSFRWVCKQLGLDKSAVRRALLVRPVPSRKKQLRGRL